MSKPSKSEKVSPLVQALDASNPPSLPSYLPSHLATAINFTYSTPLQGGVATSRGHTHLAATGTTAAAGLQGGGKGLYQQTSDPSQIGASAGGTTTSNLSNLSNPFLGQSQPGFPASCFRVKGHTDGGSGSDATASTSSATTSSESSSNINMTSYSSCLGPDWPDLGITLGQGPAPSKAQSKMSLVPDLGTAVNQSVNTQNKGGGVAPPPGPDLGTAGANMTTSSTCPQSSKVTVPATTLTESDASTSAAWKASSVSNTSSGQHFTSWLLILNSKSPNQKFKHARV